MPELSTLSVGFSLHNRYRVLEFIGGGATARVYKVEHSQLKTLHALKELALDQTEEGKPEMTYETTQREARFLSTLSHPSIPKATDFFRDANKVYIVMDFIEGTNLKRLLDQRGIRNIDLTTILQWGIQICDALAYLHRQEPPIIFRDLKPSNLILRPNGTICLVDFGIARQMRKGASSDTIVFGSQGYSPPEQYGHSQTDPRSDLYAFGATMHHLITGRDPSFAPFKWPSLRSVNPLMPIVLDRLILRCVEMDSARRPESAEMVGRSLRAIAEMLEEQQHPLPAYSPVIVEEGEPAQTMLLNPMDDLDEDPPTSLSPSIQRVVEKTKARNGQEAARPRPIASVQPLPEPQAVVSAVRPARALTAFQQALQSTLLTYAILIVLGGLVFPFFNDRLAPPASTITAPAPPGKQSSRVERDDYALREQEYEEARTAAQHAATIYNNLTPIRYGLDVMVCLAFLFGVILPIRPAYISRLLAIGGVLALICFTGAIFLPDRTPLFVALAVVEALLLIPATVLLSAELAQGETT